MDGTSGAGDTKVVSLRDYRAPQFIGEPVRVDEDFFWALDVLNTIAERRAVQIYVTSSFRKPDAVLENAVVESARTSNHLIGHAIDMNLKSASGFFESHDLKRDNLPSLPAEIRQVIRDIRADPILRWGGDFTCEDPVHIDDNLNQRDAALWLAKFRVLHPIAYADGSMVSAPPTTMG